jgi:hypothetical protein
MQIYSKKDMIMNFCRAVMMKIFTFMTPCRRGVIDHALEIRRGTMKFAVGHPPRRGVIDHALEMKSGGEQ